jgi:hypothetical protein
VSRRRWRRSPAPASCTSTASASSTTPATSSLALQQRPVGKDPVGHRRDVHVRCRRPPDARCQRHDQQHRRLENFAGGSTNLLENAGTYYNQGWITADGLQGPNEPDNNRDSYWDSIRATLRGLKDAKARRRQHRSWRLPTTSRAYRPDQQGPAFASQLPVVGPHLVGNNWGSMGSYTNGGHQLRQPAHVLGWARAELLRADRTGPWAGRAACGAAPRATRGLPRYCTETGYQNRPGYDSGNPKAERYTPEDVTAEYLIRTLIMNYLINVRRTYLYKLCDESSVLIAAVELRPPDLQLRSSRPVLRDQEPVGARRVSACTTSVPLTVNVDRVHAGRGLCDRRVRWRQLFDA